MKKLVLAAFIAAFAAGSQTLAAVSSLPIGSVEKVLNHELANTWQISINVSATSDGWKSFSLLFAPPPWRSYVKDDGTVEDIHALCQRASLSSDKTELKMLLERIMREAVRVSVKPNDPALQGKTMEVSLVGEWQSDPTNYLQNVGTFVVVNDFSLKADSNGNMAVPETSYETDMHKAITYPINQGFWIDGVVKAEIRNTQGNVLERDTPLSWITIASVIVISDAYVFGQQPGVVQLWYADGTTQTFSLDGSLISNLSPLALTITPVPAGAIAPLSSAPRSAVKLTVTGVSGAVTLEWSENLKGWKVLTVFTNSTGSVSTVDSATGSARFYRAVVGK